MTTKSKTTGITINLIAPRFREKGVRQKGDDPLLTTRDAMFAFRLQSLSTTLRRPAHSAILLTRLGALDYVPGVERAIELRYVVRPMVPNHQPPTPLQWGNEGSNNDLIESPKAEPIVECYLIFRVSDWRFPARVQVCHARRYAVDIEKTLQHALPGYHFTPVRSKMALARARCPFRIKDTGEVRRRAAATHFTDPIPLPFEGLPDLGALVDMMQAQSHPTILTLAVEPLPVCSRNTPHGTNDVISLEEHGSEISQILTETPDTARRLSEASVEVQTLRQQAEQFVALQRRAFKLRVQLSSAGPIADSLVNSVLGELGGVGRYNADVVCMNPSLPIVAGALWIRPRSTRIAAGGLHQYQRDGAERSLPQVSPSEQTLAMENLNTIGFTPWGNVSSQDEETIYLANLGEVSRLFSLPQSVTWLPKSTLALNLPYMGRPDVAPSSVRLGLSCYGNGTCPVYLSPYARDHHTWIVGQTGTGKSTLLGSVIVQDIYAGRPVIVLDPHGDLINDVLGRIPTKRRKDVIHFDAADNVFPIGINPLEARGEAAKALVVSALIGLLRKLYDPYSQGIVGPRFEHAVRNALLTIMSKPGSTLVELVRVITDQHFLNEMLKYVKDPIVERYWTDQIANTNDFHKSEVLDWIVSKFGRFVTDPTIRRIIGQSRSGFSFREAMDNGKIVLLSLEKGSIGGENATFLGLVLLPMILQAALSRVNIPYSERQPVSLFVDEFQNYATDSVAQMLAESRKYRLALTLANQHIGQLTPEIREAVIGNVGSILAFRLGTTDAQIMEQVLAPSPVEASHLGTLPNFVAYGRVLDGEARSNTFTLATEPPNVESDALLVSELSETSRRRYGTHKEKVDFELSERAKLVRR